jgi:hypothetical protein
MAITHEAFEAAHRRAARKLATTPIAIGVRYDPGSNRIVIALSSGIEVSFPPQLAQGLEHAQATDLHEIEISPSGLGIHFPRGDADLYLPALLEGMFGSRQWLAARIGKLGGQARSVAKARAARENGKRGGRPKKTAGAPG